MKSRTSNAATGLGRMRLGLGLLSMLVAGTWATQAHAVRGNAPVSGEIQYITINNPADHWSGGTIVVGGTSVILPKNLLLDLPANRLTLQQLYEQAPAACVALGQTGLAKGDTCNTSGMGAIAAISANRSAAGNVIAGDALISKAAEAVTGEVTYINYTDGYFRLNGNLGDPATGVMVRLNDPTSRHTVQQGLGCAPGAANCSADPRFTLDPDNYVNVFSSGYPYCIPSTVQRTASVALPSQVGVTIPALAVGAIVRANADGTGDALCPTTNRTINGGQPVDDSRRFAPIMMGDSVTAEGNFELVNGVQFLSAHTTMIGNNALATKSDPGQPDYIFLDEVGLDAAGFQNQRARSLFIGFASLAPNDVVIWSIHRDPTTGAAHEFPLASVVGCDNAAGAGTCGGQGLVGAGNRIWKIRHDVDFDIGAKARWDPCAHLRADPRFTGLNICPGSNAVAGGGGGGGGFATNINEMFSILSPMPREIQARTGHKLANPSLITLDVNGNQATNGQYLFPFGANLGGVSFPEMVEIDLNALNLPTSFTGLPWTLDRRLSPGGCDGPCETTAQPLDPYPYEGFDPRTQANVPTTSLTDRNYTDTTLTSARDRILSYVDASKVRLAGNGFETPAAGNFNGNATLLALPPIDPAQLPIGVTPVVPPFVVGAASTNTPPVAVADAATTDNRTPVTIAVLANDSDADGNTLSVAALTVPSSGTARINPDKTVTFTPAAGFAGSATFGYTVSDGSATATAIVTVTVTQPVNRAPTANPDTATVALLRSVNISVLANDTDPDGDPLTVSALGASACATCAPTKGTVVIAANVVTYTPAAGAVAGTDTFGYTVSDGRGGVAQGLVTVTLTATQASEAITITRARFTGSASRWVVTGTDTVLQGQTLSIVYNNGKLRNQTTSCNGTATIPDCVIARVQVDAAGAYKFDAAVPAGPLVPTNTTAWSTTPTSIKVFSSAPVLGGSATRAIEFQ